VDAEAIRVGVEGLLLESDMVGVGQGGMQGGRSGWSVGETGTQSHGRSSLGTN
jgi:hypothetical protein